MLPAELQFRHPWRAYQQRILDDLDRHAADGHFHVVAAPGSGKTVLGLEVVRRIGKPALVAAPTLALRDQWIDRLVHQFLAGARPAWISEEATTPGLLTFETYQALHARAKGEGIGALAAVLRARGVGALVFDEAHHLKREWWRTLEELHSALGRVFVVALTATPPYDVSQAEWNHYLALAGPVDAEISAAELVRSGDLCPHQDYVYLQKPTARELERLSAFDEQVSSFLGDLCLDRELVRALQGHPAVADPAGQLAALLEEPEYALSIAVLLRHADGLAPRALLETLGLEADVLPRFDAWWAERLLEGALFRDEGSFGVHREHLKLLRRRLRQLGALERRKVRLLASPAADRMLRASPAKLRAVSDIVEAEGRSLGEALRALVLTERIREGEWTESAETERRIGVVPIFDRLRRLRLPHVRLCAATGRVGIVPREMAGEVEGALRRRGSSGADACLREAGVEESGRTPLAPEYRLFSLSAGEAAVFVRAVTQALERGALTVIVGTTSLLGEGWDCPAVNTVVLATTIGSFVSSNQSRGRALRRDPLEPLKTANIWHPVCVDVRGARESEELALLRRRFSAFMGPGLSVPTLESGLARLLPEGELTQGAVDVLNARMFRHAEDRSGMAELWRRCLVPAGGGQGRPVRETSLARRVVWRTAVSIAPQGRLARWIERWRSRRTASAVTRAVVEALRDAEIVAAPAAPLVIRVVDAAAGRIAIRVSGLAARDEMLLHRALQEVFCPLFSPRYLLATRRRTWAVPKDLGENREGAEALYRRWRRRVGRARLVYTRTPDGKRTLLRAVQWYLANHCRERAETTVRWT